MTILQCVLVTPEATLRDGPADFVVVPLYDGELGIAPGHAPMIGRLGAGELRVQDQGELGRYYVEGGFVEVIDDTVTVLTGRAVPAAEIDAKATAGQLREARSAVAASPEAMAARDQAVAQARAKLRVARRTGDS